MAKINKAEVHLLSYEFWTFLGPQEVCIMNPFTRKDILKTVINATIMFSGENSELNFQCL